MSRELRDLVGSRPLPPSQDIARRFVTLTPGIDAVYVYYQIGKEDDAMEDLLTDFIAHLIQEPCFRVLRTEQQLGYAVHSGLHSTRNVQGLFITVQSPRFNPSVLNRRVDEFLFSYANAMEDMPEEEFQKYKDSLIAYKLRKDLNLSAQRDRYWAEIVFGKYRFNKAKEEAEMLKTVTKKMVTDFFRRHVTSVSARKLTISCYSLKHLDTAPQGAQGSPHTLQVVQIKDLACWKKAQPLFSSKS